MKVQTNAIKSMKVKTNAIKPGAPERFGRGRRTAQRVNRLLQSPDERSQSRIEYCQSPNERSSERRGNSVKGFKDFNLKAKARILL
jgi:hypothetical protein